MGAESAFEQAVRKIIEKSTPITITEGTVKSVDKAARTCDVERDDLPELFDVRLTATLEPGDDVATIFPTPGSRCLVALVEGQPTDAFMLSATDIEEVAVRIGESEMVANKDKVSAKCGSSEVTLEKAGLTIKKDDSLKSILESIIDQMAAITVTGSFGTSSIPVNSPQMVTIKANIAKLFKG
ncbi:hypothetical protein [Acetobacteroides hydrogenigenes]|uniref:Phage protein Gp138 N-terminal domain-containing protein n=1 Tax=Acetobacteroides hydrogenigenes TaxID=979970 RepID=A0A4R2E5L3_9BACT|nr:hypothetical protein [Acetobacteroides hydrogenigenes]TCN63678.1 hypothetical protein CLV25_11528 [Acetobacteroides hydrogenigenes]